MLKDKIIALDLDDVVIDTLPAMLKIYNKKYNKNIKPENITSWTMSPEMVDCFKEITYDMIREKNESISAIKEMLNIFKEVLIVTASCPETFVEKVRWIKDNIPEFNPNNIILCHEKHRIRANILIDDKYDNVESFMGNTKGIALLYTMPHNKHIDGVLRADSLQSMLRILQILEELSDKKRLEKEID